MNVDANTRLKLKADEISAAVIDGEVILVNLTTGVYYSIGGVGGAVWELLEAGHSVGEIAVATAARFGAAREQILPDLTTLAGCLVEEDLVEEVMDGQPPAPPAQEVAANSQPYAAPELSVYRDMSDLLALDPPMPGLRDIPWQGSDETGES